MRSQSTLLLGPLDPTCFCSTWTPCDAGRGEASVSRPCLFSATSCQSQCVRFSGLRSSSSILDAHVHETQVLDSDSKS